MSLKKAIINERDLPPLTVFKDGSFGYRVRYRVVSEDGSRFSHYSPIKPVRANYSFVRPEGRSLSDFSIIRIGPYLNIVWQPVSVKDRPSQKTIKIATSYDVWLRWSRGENNAVWVLQNAAEGSLQGFVLPQSYSLADGTQVNQEPNLVSAEVYIKSSNPSRDNELLLVYRIVNQDISAPFSPPSN